VDKSTIGDNMINVVSERTAATKKWKIPDKFINAGFADFLNNTFPLEEGKKERDTIAITGFASVKEYADHFQLQENYGITLDAILKLLDDKGCIEINKKENRLKYHHQNIEYLRVEIMARI
jgi:hypothetical protein